MPEFVIVSHPVRRRVIINGAPNGFTNDTLIVSRGTHQFDLGTPPDYTPLSQTVAVAGTTPTAPMTVAFQPVVTAVVVAASASAAAPPAAGAPGRGIATRRPLRKRKQRKTTARKAAARKKTGAKNKARKGRKKTARHK